MLRIATINLLNKPYELPARVDQLVSELEDQDVDFLLLQEVLPPADGYFSLAHLSRDLHLPYVHYTRRSTADSGNAVLSKHPFTPITMHETFPDRYPAIVDANVDGRRVVAISHHGAFGSHAQGTRVEQLYQIDGVVAQLFRQHGAALDRGTRPVIFLGGDLNANPDDAPIRFLRGADPLGVYSTLWVDAGAHVGETGHTTGGNTELCKMTAASRPGAPYRPERTPLRRIDYVFVYEWCYGQAGEPVAVQRIGLDTFKVDGLDLTISDHYGLLVDLWTPQKRQFFPGRG